MKSFKTPYKKRVWLNPENSRSCSNMVAFDDIIEWDGENIRETFLQISDCSESIRLHKSRHDTNEDFLNKMKLLKAEIELFIDHLEKSNETRAQTTQLHLCRESKRV